MTRGRRAAAGAQLVGSVPLANSESVLRTAGALLGAHLRRVPDGETGERSNRVAWQRPILLRNPAFEAAGAHDPGTPQPLRIRAGVDAARIEIGALGYAAHARASFVVFARCRRGSSSATTSAPATSPTGTSSSRATARCWCGWPTRPPPRYRARSPGCSCPCRVSTTTRRTSRRCASCACRTRRSSTSASYTSATASPARARARA